VVSIHVYQTAVPRQATVPSSRTTVVRTLGRACLAWLRGPPRAVKTSPWPTGAVKSQFHVFRKTVPGRARDPHHRVEGWRGTPPGRDDLNEPRRFRRHGVVVHVLRIPR